MFKNYYKKILIILGIVLLDLVTKNILEGKSFVVIKNILSFTSSHNAGAAWSILEGQMTLFIVTALVFILVMFLFDYFEKEKRALYVISFSLVIAGTLGNLIDRISFSYVRDFIKVEFINFPIFNVADMALVVGAILFSVFVLFLSDKRQEDKKDEA